MSLSEKLKTLKTFYSSNFIIMKNVFDSSCSGSRLRTTGMCDPSTTTSGFYFVNLFQRIIDRKSMFRMSRIYVRGTETGEQDHDLLQLKLIKRSSCGSRPSFGSPVRHGPEHLPVEFFLNNTNLAFLYKIDMEGFLNQQK